MLCLLDPRANAKVTEAIVSATSVFCQKLLHELIKPHINTALQYHTCQESACILITPQAYCLKILTVFWSELFIANTFIRKNFNPVHFFQLFYFVSRIHRKQSVSSMITRRKLVEWSPHQQNQFLLCSNDLRLYEVKFQKPSAAAPGGGNSGYKFSAETPGTSFGEGNA